MATPCDFKGIYNFSNYKQIFDLHEIDLHKTILDFKASISSFNAEMHRIGHHVVSMDPLYALTPQEIKSKTEQILHSQDHKQKIQPDLALFIEDYPLGKKQERYVPLHLSLKSLPQKFQLVLCKNLLSEANCAETITALCNLGEEIRLFPILNDKGMLCENLGPILLQLQQANLGTEIRQVKHNDAMLRIWTKECPLK